MKREVLD